LLFRVAVMTVLLATLAGCGTLPLEGSAAHLVAPEPVSGVPPQPVQRSLELARPKPVEPEETYSVVVHRVPVRDLLFALFRDARVEADLDPGIEGEISLNAMDQTLATLLERIARQARLSYEWSGKHVAVRPDSPHLRHYRVDYVNIRRVTSGRMRVRSTVGSTGTVVGGAGAGAESSESAFDIDQTSTNEFWDALAAHLSALLAGGAEDPSGVIIHRETGLVSVRATARQHQEVRLFLDDVLDSAQRQVLIEATIVEIELNDDYQAGVDWGQFGESQRGNTTIHQDLLGSDLAVPPAFRFKGVIWDSAIGSISATVRALSKFGDTRVLSSPRLMVLNNQSAVLKVVDELVYFEIESNFIPGTATTPARTEYSSAIRTAPVGLVMSVTPQISAGEVVSLNVRPSVSRVIGYRSDPIVKLLGMQDGVENLIPEIQVREMESILRIPSGQTVVLGGLMQDDVRNRTSGLPGAARVPLVGNLFSHRSDQVRKSELVVFLRPVVIRHAGLDGDFAHYRRYLPQPGEALNRREGMYPLASDALQEHDLGEIAALNVPRTIASAGGLVDEASLRRMAREEPERGDAHFQIGNLHASQRRWPDAQQAWYEAVLRAPDNPDYLFNLAVSLEHLGQRHAAREYYRKAVDRAAHHPAGFAIDQAEGRIAALERKGGGNER